MLKGLREDEAFKASADALAPRIKQAPRIQLPDKSLENIERAECRLGVV
jgi:hypothetical protein